jgi:tRNA (guanine-N7-)-methyltransferase
MNRVNRTFRPRPKPGAPYADAPRFADEGEVSIPALVTGSRIELEIGPGRGGFIRERALCRPDVGIVGLEVRRKWAAIVDARLAREGLGARARVFAEDAKDALTRLAPDACVAAVFVHFPDPWWKKRHDKRIVLDAALLGEIARLLMPEGELFVQTDVEARIAQYEALVAGDARFEPKGDTPESPSLEDNPYEARSPRERRAMADGLPIYRRRWRLKPTTATR